MLHRNNALLLQPLSYLFILIVIVIQLIPPYIGLALLFIMLLLDRIHKSRTQNEPQLLYWISALYIIGYLLAQQISHAIFQSDLTIEWKIILSRFSLISFILPFFIHSKISKVKPQYLAVGSFKHTIYFPFIWKGFAKDPIWRFLIIASSIIILSFIFFIDFKQPAFYTLLLYAIVFAFINSILEEILWRGYILSSFVTKFGEIVGLFLSSIAFGFYHFSLGIPWVVCALFSLFGMLLGGIAMRSRGLLPVTILHFIMNILFVLIGIIL